MNKFFKKAVLALLAVELAFAAFPVTGVLAMDDQPPQGELSNEKLEAAWAGQLKAYNRLGKVFDQKDSRLEKLQELIDKAAANGKDVSALQAALDAFSASIKAAKPTYESMNGIVNSHQGFDQNGKVTDPEKAKSTVQEMRTKLQEVKSKMGGTGKALRDAIKAFRDANKPVKEAPDTRGT